MKQFRPRNYPVVISWLFLFLLSSAHSWFAAELNCNFTAISGDAVFPRSRYFLLRDKLTSRALGISRVPFVPRPWAETLSAVLKEKGHSTRLCREGSSLLVPLYSGLYAKPDFVSPKTSSYRPRGTRKSFGPLTTSYSFLSGL